VEELVLITNRDVGAHWRIGIAGRVYKVVAQISGNPFSIASGAFFGARF